MSQVAIQTRVCPDTIPDNLAEHPVLRRIYASRGVQSAQELDYNLAGLLPAKTLAGLSAAIDRLTLAIESQQRIMIIGDFDADGATSSALAVSALQAFGAQYVDFIVPNRFDYGYGLTPEIVDLAYECQPNVIITVDNGIASIDGVARAKEYGIDVVITDHHLPGRTLPEAAAIVNPNLPDCAFASGALAGVGVIFYVMSALRTHLQSREWFTKHNITIPNMAGFLDLVALGTVADVVPLDHNNRILVQQGIARCRAGLARVGIQALLAISGRSMAQLSAADFGFAVGPRLNAAGRLTDMRIGIQCLLATDYQQAYDMAQSLDDLNKERRRIESDMHLQALQSLSKHDPQAKAEKEKRFGYCFYQPDWHQGVIGILAGRLKEKLHRPVIAFANTDDDTLKGSARSIPGVHIRDVLDRVAVSRPDILTKFGGHAMAAGLSIAKKDLSVFSDCFNEAVQTMCDPEQLQAVIYTDGELPATDLSLNFAAVLQDAGPWGQTFPAPLFQGEFECLSQRIVGEKHLKMSLRAVGGELDIDAIAFNVDLAHWPNHRIDRVACVYALDINVWRGVRRLQLVVEHLAVVSAPVSASHS